MRRATLASAIGTRLIRRRSLTRRLTHDENLPAELANALWRGDAERLLYESTPLQVKDRCIVARHEGPDGPLLVKRHTWGGLWRTFRLSWREPPARYCARVARRLAEEGIRTPRPRAVLEERLGPFGYRSYLITDYVAGMDLYRFIRYEAPTDAQLRHLARQVARIWQRLVELGISHHDMKPENFIVDDELGVWLIDFERLRLGGDAERQRQRQLADVRDFLHSRGWHHRPAARQVFIEEFLRTSFGEWLREAAVEAASDVDADLPVLVPCNELLWPEEAQEIELDAPVLKLGPAKAA